MDIEAVGGLEVLLLLERLWSIGKRCNACGKANVDDIEALLLRLCAKYSDHGVYGEASVHFASKRHSKTNATYCMSLHFFDNTNAGVRGYYGEAGVRILWGYGDHRKEKTVFFIEKEKY